MFSVFNKNKKFLTRTKSFKQEKNVLNKNKKFFKQQ